MQPLSCSRVLGDHDCIGFCIGSNLFFGGIGCGIVRHCYARLELKGTASRSLQCSGKRLKLVDRDIGRECQAEYVFRQDQHYSREIPDSC